jgi:hypothetical protein
MLMTKGLLVRLNGKPTESLRLIIIWIPALPDGSAVIFVGPDIVEAVPEPLKYNMVGQFGGPCFDEKKREWNTSFPVEVDGSIEVDDGWEFNQVQHLGKNPRQIRAVSLFRSCHA